MVVDQNAFFRKRLFFTNKNIISVNFSRIPFLFFTEPILINNIFYENSFTFCQIIPKNYKLVLDSLLNIQLTSQNPFSKHIITS